MNENTLQDIIIEFLGDKKEKEHFKKNFKYNNKNFNLLKIPSTNTNYMYKNIDINIKKKLKNNILELEDIPEVIELLKDIFEIFNFDFIDVKNISSNDGSEFIKNTLEIMIYKDYVNVKDKMKAYKLIDITCSLLKHKLDVKASFFRRLKNCFGIKD